MTNDGRIETLCELIVQAGVADGARLKRLLFNHTHTADKTRTLLTRRVAHASRLRVSGGL